MRLNEVVKNFLAQPEPKQDKESSNVNKDNVLVDLTNDDLYPNTVAFFDENDGGIFNTSRSRDIIQQQDDKIRTYRQMAMTPDVMDAIDEIVNEIIFSYDDKMPLMIEIDEENEKLIKAITEKFEKIMRLMNIKRNAFQIVKRGYVDGQLIMHTAYDKNSTANGIRSIKMIDPCGLYFDVKTNTYKYLDKKLQGYIKTDVEKEEYSIEEIVREDFGLYDGKINLGYLEYALKPANMLKTLEDLLVPLRFSRSISRRVFNVDIGDLPAKRGAEVMREYQNKFKYKKFYNNETGEVSNQQHITSMVEDYWFSNRSGGKGTTVDTLDETGNLGEMDDILYFVKKLYRAMKIPDSRINLDPDSDKEFDYESTRTSKEDMKFFMFISRLRQVYSSLFKEILKREVIATKIMSESEWDEKEDLISISFVNENKFIEKMKLENFTSKVDIYSQVQDYQGKLFSVETILKDVFRMSEEEIKEEFEKIHKEEKDPLYQRFYQNDEEGSQW
ncbi:portal protein [Vibrio phage VB_VaC_TDDLMA]